MINRYTIFGQPVAHSLSPAIHHLFGELTQRRVQYTRTEATAENFDQKVRDWRNEGGRGCNVTAPFKEQAFTLCDRVNDNAARAGAVNTIEMHRDGSLVGHNTDGIGLLTDLQANKHLALEGKRILVLGAGGAARGVLAPLLNAQPTQVHIANRTPERAAQLSALFADLGDTHSSDYNSLANAGCFDLIINATSMGFDNDSPPIPGTILSANTFAYDMMYKRATTPFLKWCIEQGVQQHCDGFGMLVEQAADAFLVWEGVRPKTRKVYLATNDILNSV